jgi:ASCH domain
MKALTLWQPWATAISLGLKQYETRTWFVGYRGELAIHAAKKPITKEIVSFFQKHYPAWENLLNLAERQKGCIVATCNLIDCIEMDDSLIAQQPPLELIFGNWQVGRYAWKLDNLQPVKAIPFSGSQGLREVPHAIIKQMNNARRISSL